MSEPKVSKEEIVRVLSEAIVAVVRPMLEDQRRELLFTGIGEPEMDKPLTKRELMKFLHRGVGKPNGSGAMTF